MSSARRCLIACAGRRGRRRVGAASCLLAGERAGAEEEGKRSGGAREKGRRDARVAG
jgi:hypothetical protein